MVSECRQVNVQQQVDINCLNELRASKTKEENILLIISRQTEELRDAVAHADLLRAQILNLESQLRQSKSEHDCLTFELARTASLLVELRSAKDTELAIELQKGMRDAERKEGRVAPTENLAARVAGELGAKAALERNSELQRQADREREAAQQLLVTSAGKEEAEGEVGLQKADTALAIANKVAAETRAYEVSVLQEQLKREYSRSPTSVQPTQDTFKGELETYQPAIYGCDRNFTEHD